MLGPFSQVRIHLVTSPWPSKGVQDSAAVLLRRSRTSPTQGSCETTTCLKTAWKISALNSFCALRHPKRHVLSQIRVKVLLEMLPQIVDVGDLIFPSSKVTHELLLTKSGLEGQV